MSEIVDLDQRLGAITAQLRHLYVQMTLPLPQRELVNLRSREMAEGLLAPAIRKLEHLQKRVVECQP